MTQSLAIPSYIYPDYSNPTGYWNQMIAAAGPVSIVLINPGSGPGSSSDSNYVTQVTDCHTAGLKVIGYVHTGYTTISAATIEAQIDDYYSWYGVDGIFIDEVTTAAGDQSYYAGLYSYIKGKSGDDIVIINPGTIPDESYMTACDICCNCETDLGTYRTRVPAAWESGYAADRFWHIVYAAGWWGDGTAQMYEALNLSRSYNAGYVWITSDVEPNPYDTLPTGSYWTDLIAQVTTPTTLTGPWPALEDGFDQDSGALNSQWSATGSVSISSYQLQITGHATYADHLDSAAAFDFTAQGSASVQAVTMPSASSGEAFMQLIKDGSNLLCIGKSGANLLCRYKTAGTASDTTVTWNATSMAYWRIAYSGGTVTWQTSPDRVTWTTQRTVTSGLPALTSVTQQLIAGHYTGGDPDQTSVFDNILAGEPGTGGAGGGGTIVSGQYLRAPSVYAPASQTTYTVSTTTMAAFSSTNLNTGSFTAPTSGEVMVTVSFVAQASASAGFAVSLAAHGTVTPLVADSVICKFPTSATATLPVMVSFMVSGLTSGTAYTFDLVGCATTSDTASILAIGNASTTPTVSFGGQGAPVVFTVQAV